MAYNNFTVSDFNFNEAQGDDLSSNPAARLTIAPDDGYVVLATDFSLVAPFPSGVDASTVTFTQSGSLIYLDVNFLPGTIMPGNDIDVPLCISGFARFAPYSVQGVVNLGTQNATPVSQQYTYSQTGDFTQTKLVWNQTIQASPGFYFYQAPIAAINNGDPSAYNIITTETLNQYNELVAITYDINYTFPASSVTGDIVNIQAIAIPSVGNTTYINAFNVSGIGNFNQPPIPDSGDTRVLNLFGDPNAVFSASLFEYGKGAGGAETVLASNVSMPSSGQYSIPGIVFPPATDNAYPYKIIISGDINPSIANVNNTVEISFAQTTAVTFTVTATSSSGDFDITGVNPIEFIAVPNYTYGPGEINTFSYSWTTSAVSGNDVVDVGSIDANSFNPVIPDPSYPGTLYSAGPFSSTLSGNDKSVKFQGAVTIQTTQDSPISHTIDIDSFIDEVAGPGAWVAARCNDPSITEKVSLTEGFSDSDPQQFSLLAYNYSISDVVWIKDTLNGTIYCAELISQDAVGTPTMYIDEKGGVDGKYSACSGPNACNTP